MGDLKGKFFYRKIKFTVIKRKNSEFYFLDVIPDASNPLSVTINDNVIFMSDDDLDNLITDFTGMVDDYIEEYTSKGNKYIE